MNPWLAFAFLIFYLITYLIGYLVQAVMPQESQDRRIVITDLLSWLTDRGKNRGDDGQPPGASDPSPPED